MPDDATNDEFKTAVSAEVERQLRASGVRTVDKEQGGSGGSKFTNENLEASLDRMTSAEILESLASINEVMN